MVEGGGVLGLKDGDGVARGIDTQEKRCVFYNNRWISLVTGFLCCDRGYYIRLGQVFHGKSGGLGDVSFVKKGLESTGQIGEFLSGCLAFPDDKHPPAETSESTAIVLVAFDVSSQFAHPVRAPGGWYAIASATAVLMPETSVDEDDLSTGGKDDIRVAGEILSVQAESVPK